MRAPDAGRLRAVPRVRRRYPHGHGRPGVAGGRGIRPGLPAKGIRCNAGHSHATFEQVEAAIGWGVRHVDHLFCAMSDRARLRQTQTYPMRGGVMEATLYFDELTTEVIADGKHLAPALLKLAYKVKGPDRLALVTDAMRAWTCRTASTSSARSTAASRSASSTASASRSTARPWPPASWGWTIAVRTFAPRPGAPLPEAVRMATLTPARIAGVDAEVGSIALGKKADLVVTDRDLNVRAVYIDGQQLIP